MSQTPAVKPELLAPAGSMEAFFAAMDAGADAVYTGLREFSARAKAKNFSFSEIDRLTRYAQGEGKRLYVTLNTLVKESELPQLIDCLGALEQIGVNAIIVQDLAIWKLARDHFPGLELHSSTQLTVHNAAGVKMLERMGFTRAVLARELSLQEISAIRRQTRLELEHFIHGALCFSFSGQCYFSSFLGGLSGNRGRCAQPCRRRHSHRQQQGYYFSTNDLSAIDLLEELGQVGICSLKIEGRMKSAEYVHKVVGAYRQVLDAQPAEKAQLIKEAKLQLKESFGRQPTRGFLPGGQPTDIAIPSLKGATGRYLGDVGRVRGGEISFKTRAPLQLGDRIRIQPASDKAGTAFTIRQLKLGQRSVNQTRAGSLVSVTSTFHNQFKVGDGVFLVSSSQAYSLSDAAIRRRLSQLKPRQDQVDLEIDCTPDQLRITASSTGLEQRLEFPIESYPAREKPLDREVLQQVFAVTAGEPFRLGQLTCGELPSVVIPPKQLKQIRRDLYSSLRQQRQPQRDRLKQEHIDSARQALLPQRKAPPADKREIRVLLRDGRDQHLLQDHQVDQILLPLSGGNLQAASKLKRRSRQLIWDIPFILFDQDWDATRSAIRQLVGLGYCQFRLNNLSHFPLFDGLEGLKLFSSFRLFALNSQAISAWKELGICEAELYIEDGRENLAAILSHELPLPTALTVYASVPLITSRISIKSIRPDQPVLSDRGDAYRVQQRQGLSWLRSETDFSFLANLGELQSFGCHSFIIDLSHLGPFTPPGKRVLDSLRHANDPPGTSKFNYERGVE